MATVRGELGALPVAQRARSGARATRAMVCARLAQQPAGALHTKRVAGKGRGARVAGALSASALARVRRPAPATFSVRVLLVACAYRPARAPFTVAGGRAVWACGEACRGGRARRALVAVEAQRRSEAKATAARLSGCSSGEAGSGVALQHARLLIVALRRPARALLAVQGNCSASAACASVGGLELGGSSGSSGSSSSDARAFCLYHKATLKIAPAAESAGAAMGAVALLAQARALLIEAWLLAAGAPGPGAEVTFASSYAYVAALLSSWALRLFLWGSCGRGVGGAGVWGGVGVAVGRALLLLCAVVCCCGGWQRRQCRCTAPTTATRLVPGAGELASLKQRRRGAPGLFDLKNSRPERILRHPLYTHPLRRSPPAAARSLAA